MVESVLLRELDSEIQLHERHNANESYLDKALHVFYHGGDQSLQDLKHLRAQIDPSASDQLQPMLDAQTSEAIKQDVHNLKVQKNVEQYGGGFLKATSLFVAGKLGFGATAVVFGLDRARPCDSLQNQLIDGALGASTGLLTKGLLTSMPAMAGGPIARGALIGASTRVLTIGLDRRSYLDRGGNFSFGQGFDTVINVGLDPTALALQAAEFGLAAGAFHFANAATGGALGQSELLRTTLSAYGMGLTSGTVGELYRQKQAGENLDVLSALKSGALDGLVTAGGALAGAGINSAGEFIMHHNQVKIPVLNIQGQQEERYFRKGSLLPELYEENSPKVVKIETPTGQGTGFFVRSDGVIITNHHVIDGITGPPIVNVITADGHTYPGMVSHVDAAHDLAVVRILSEKPVNFPVVEFPNPYPAALVQHEDVAAIGYPGGAVKAQASLGELTETTHIFSKSGDAADALKARMPVRGGDSGSPLLDVEGKLLGVVAQTDGTNGYAISTDYVLQLLQRVPRPGGR